MAETATLNVRMDTDTKDELLSFCNEIGISASALMNMFAKTVVRNQCVPFPLTTRHTAASLGRYANIFPRSEEEIDDALAEAEAVPMSECVSAKDGFSALERRMGW